MSEMIGCAFRFPFLLLGVTDSLYWCNTNTMCNFHLPPPPKRSSSLILSWFLLFYAHRSPFSSLSWLHRRSPFFCCLFFWICPFLCLPNGWPIFHGGRSETRVWAAGPPGFWVSGTHEKTPLLFFPPLVLNRHMSSGHKNVLKQLKQERKNTQEDFLDFQTNEVYFKCSFEGWIR